MPGVEKLHLEDSLEDSPQTRSLVGLFEEDAKILKKYSSNLHRGCQRVLNAQNELSAATMSLSQHLKDYEKQRFPLESEESILSSTLKQFSSYLDELSSVHQVLATQLGDSMMFPLTKFLQADLDEITTMSGMLQLTANEHEESIYRFMKLSKKKENPKLKTESIEDLFAMRKKFHQTALHYYAALNAIQYKKRSALLEPMVGFLQAQKSFFEMGKDTICKQEIEDFVANISASVEEVHRELAEETRKTVDTMDSIEKTSTILYYPEPTAEVPCLPPNNRLAQKAGYLFLRSKQGLLASKWERYYFFIQGGNLMCQAKNEVAGSLIMDLNGEGTFAEPVESDDRRHTFQVASPALKKTVILQAENETEKDEWIMTVNNVVIESGYVVSKEVRASSEQSDSSSGSLSRITEAISIPAVRQMKSELAHSGPPPTPPSTPAEGGFIPDAPIQFDMISPSEAQQPYQNSQKEGPPKRINPFDQSGSDIVNDNLAENAAFCQNFEVRFLGSMEVKHDRGDQLVYETIRQILAARAIHNVFKMTDSNLLVSSVCMRLLDPANKSIRAQFELEDISYWAAHKENKRLFGFITRSKSQSAKGVFTCHIFECNSSGEEICHAISTATKLAFQALMERKAQEKQRVREQQEDDTQQFDMDPTAADTEILMANITQMEDKPTTPKLSADGQFIVLEKEELPGGGDSSGNVPPGGTVGIEATAEEIGSESEA